MAEQRLCAVEGAADDGILDTGDPTTPETQEHRRMDSAVAAEFYKPQIAKGWLHRLVRVLSRFP